jgi:hypothetical protein
MQIRTEGLKELLASLDNVSDNLAKEAYTALGKAGNKTRSGIAKTVSQTINVKQKAIRKQTAIKKNRRMLTVTVSLNKSARIPLKEFSAKQTKPGVTAKIPKKGGRKTYTGAFQITKFGNHVFSRREGQGRKLFKLHGPSPWGVLIKNKDKIALVVEIGRAEIRKQLAERIRYVELKKAGKLNWQQNKD